MIAQPLAPLSSLAPLAGDLAAGPKSQEVTDWAARIGWVAGLLLFVALLYWLMRQGWKWRGTLQGDLPEPPPLPGSPEGTGAADGAAVLLHATGRYHGSTTAGHWLDRIVAHGLGARSRAELTLTESGVHVVRPGARDFLIPAGALRGARLDTGIAGKVLTEGGLLVIVWQLGDRRLDSGFRFDHAAEHAAWVERLEELTPRASSSVSRGSDGGTASASGDSGVAGPRPHHTAVTPERDT